MYADDPQLYIIMRQSIRATELQDLMLCIQDIMPRNVSNMLKCNPEKTEIIHFSSLFSPGRANQFLLSRLEIVQFVWEMKLKTLGSQLTAISPLKLTSTKFVAQPHVLFITSEKLGTFYLDLILCTKERLIHAFVSGLLQQHSSRPTLLRARRTTTVANTAAWLTVRAKKSANITPILKSLHWLPLKESRNYF